MFVWITCERKHKALVIGFRLGRDQGNPKKYLVKIKFIFIAIHEESHLG